ncbi:MAG: ATP-dependent DNA helicase [Cyanobacteria bacterium]|nr:ATP-dependent DNA helicase [Cyanobacteriota bacterium]MDA1021281.1 ATP-dependent DNA helicase [Cyanobacteriota bacterium]
MRANLFDWAKDHPERISSDASSPVAASTPVSPKPAPSVQPIKEASLNPPALQADLDRANPNQLRAIKNYQGPMFIQAIPGAGKTETIATKIAYLLTSNEIDPNDKPNPDEVLILSFSDDARQNMQERLKSKLDIKTAEQIEVKTYHSFARKIIADNPQIKRFAAMGRLIDENEKFELIESIIDDLPSLIEINETDRVGKYQNLERSPRLYSNNKELVKEACKHITELKKLNIDPDQFYSASFADGGADLPANDYPRFLRNAARNELIKNFALQPLTKTDNSDWRKAKQRLEDEKEIEIFLSLLDAISYRQRYQKDSQYLEAPYRKMIRALKDKAMLDQAQEGGSLRRHFRDLLLSFCGLEIKTRRNKSKARGEKYLKSNWIEHKFKLEDLALVYREYIKELKQHQAHDFDDLVPKVVAELAHNPELKELYSNKYQYIFGDEFQDTNSAQYQLMREIAAQDEASMKSSNVCVVGDPDQSIFGFQGAASENSYKFIQDFNPLIVRSNQNYRSQAAILESADHLRGHNYLQHDLEQGSTKTGLVAEANSLEYPYKAVTIDHHQDIDTSLVHIANQIETMIDPNGQAIDPSSIAILCRENRDLAEIARTLAARKIPHSVEAKTNLLSDKDINLLHKLFQVIASPDANSDKANTNFVSLLLSPALLKSQVYLEHEIKTKDILEASASYKQAILDHQFQGSLFEYLQANSTKLEPIIDLFQDYSNKVHYADFGQLFAHAIKDFGYFNLLYSDANKSLDATGADLESIWQRRTKLQRLTEFAQSIDARTITRVNNEEQARGIDKFLHLLNYLQAKELGIRLKNPGNKSGVKILTAHKSKGKEWDHVMIYKANRGHWGNKNNSNMIKMPPTLGRDPTSIEQAISDEEEERRLFYVAMTRARKTLSIHSNAETKLGESCQPSSFVNELMTNPKEDSIQSTYHQADYRTELLAELTGKRDDRPWSEQAMAIDLDYLKARVETVRLNPTNLNLFENCARKFALQELLAGVLQIKSFAFGKAIHGALERYFTELKSLQEANLKADGKWKSGKAPIYKDLGQKLRDYYTEIIKLQNWPASEEESYLERGHTMLTNYFNKHSRADDSKSLKIFRDLRIIDVETSLRNRFEHEGLSIPSNGRIDLIVEIEDQDGIKQKVVIDFKTFAPDQDDKTNPGGKIHTQMGLYNLQLEVEQAAGKIDFVPHNYQVHFMEADSRNNFHDKSVKPSTEELLELKKRAADSYQKIQNLEFPMTDDHAKCLDCIFRLACNR